MKASEVLTKARALIATPDKWWQKNDAKQLSRLREGVPELREGIPELGDCAWTAIDVVAHRYGTTYGTDPATAYLVAQIGGDTEDKPHVRVFKWNDAPERTHAEVLAAFDRAIDAALADEAKQ